MYNWKRYGQALFCVFHESFLLCNAFSSECLVKKPNHRLSYSLYFFAKLFQKGIDGQLGFTIGGGEDNPDPRLGTAVVVVEVPSGGPASGVLRWDLKKKALFYFLFFFKESSLDITKKIDRLTWLGWLILLPSSFIMAPRVRSECRFVILSEFRFFCRRVSPAVFFEVESQL